MKAGLWLGTAAALLALSAGARRADQDFEFDDAPQPETVTPHKWRPRRYVYDPQNPLCRTLVCKKREVCLLRDAYTALCASKKEVLRRGDVIVPGTTAAWDRGDDEDVFYEARVGDRAAERCAGCGGAARASFLCGSDNRTYSSLCRLDLHNCVRRARPPVRLACRGFCPCRPNRPDEELLRRRLQAHNEVLAERARRRPAPESGASAGGERVGDERAGGERTGGERMSEARAGGERAGGERAGCALASLADRLLDWFSVLMDSAPPSTAGFPRGCKPEVRWMFRHLDAAGDGLLSPADLYSLRHDERERCLRPFLASCGGGDKGGLTRSAWCGCLRRAARPCAALARAHPAPAPGSYVPACDARGFYRARQCHAALGVCWCVDAHGVERPGSRTKGAPRCPGEKDSENSVDLGDEDETEGDVPDDDEDAGGSGDGDAPDLRY